MKKNKLNIVFVIIFFLGVVFGAFLFSNLLAQVGQADDLRLDEQEATIRAINKVMPAVVSIIVYDYEDSISIDLGTGEQTTEQKRKQKGSGTGFLISSDGLIITNKHVVESATEESGEYRIFLNSGKQYYAQLIGKDPINDLAILKIFDKDLPTVDLGNSDELQIGSTVIAIGNSLGRYRNSATKGIVSGLGRSLEAADNKGGVVSLDDAIQVDAEINLGNSGGPLIDLEGKVVGVNVALDMEGTAIGFALPVNDARQVITSVKEIGRIIRPYLGVIYTMLTPEMAYDNKLNRQTGAWVIGNELKGIPAVLPDSPASKAELEEGDIIFEVNAIRVEGIKTLFSMVQRYKPGDKIGLKIQRGDTVLIKEVTLEELK